MRQRNTGAPSPHLPSLIVPFPLLILLLLPHPLPLPSDSFSYGALVLHPFAPSPLLSHPLTHFYPHHVLLIFPVCVAIYVFIVPTMLTELLCPLQDGDTPLHLALRKGHITCVERLLSTPGINVNIEDRVS